MYKFTRPLREDPERHPASIETLFDVDVCSGQRLVTPELIAVFDWVIFAVATPGSVNHKHMQQ